MMRNTNSILGKTVLALMLCGILTTGVIGCDAGKMSESEIATVNAVMDNLMQGIEEKNYEVFSRDFNEAMSAAFDENAFLAFAEDLTEKLGAPQSREVTLSSKIQQQGEAILTVVYEITYEKDPTPVKVTIQAQTKGDIVTLTGMSFDSPVLK